MASFSRKQWDISEIGCLDVHKGATVDIGFLGGEEHRQAFAALFDKAVKDNPDLAQFNLEGVDAPRPVILSSGLQGPLREIDRLTLALELYDSRNERVFLRLSHSSTQSRLGVCFDNPEFWLESATA